MIRSFAFTLLFIAAVSAFSVSNIHAANPNIIYILLDDAGYGDLSCYGQQKFKTPNMDRLATEGMKFSDHYSGSTVCAPTRCSLLTGLHTGHTYVRGNREVQPEGQAAMPDDIVTIPRLLKRAGYTTGAFGKWGLGAPDSPSDPVEHFDQFYGYNCQRLAHNYFPTHLWKNKERIELDGQTYSADLINKATLDFIRESKDGPFFAYVATPIPHAAMHAPESYVAPFRKKFPQFEDKIGKYSGPLVKNPIAAFAGMMTLLDDHVGEILALLKELDIDDNTIIMLTSDNGAHKEGGHDPVFFNSHGPFQGFKRDLYEGGIRTPLLARWPGKIKAGSESNLVSAHWDMLPTFCELAGANVPNLIDGISMVPTLMGEPEKQQPHEYLYWEFYERGGKRAVRFGNWKAVQLNLHKNLNSPIEIYHLPDDLAEANNVADKNPEQVKKAREFFKDAHIPSQFWKFDPKANKKKNKKNKKAA